MIDSFPKIDMKTYKIGSEELKLIILRKRSEYYKKFNVYPEYIKVPVWVNKCLRTLGEYEWLSGIDAVEFFMGLKVCPTISIELPEEIEVF